MNNSAIRTVLIIFFVSLILSLSALFVSALEGEEDTTTIIETGDATSQGEVTNVVNVTNVESDATEASSTVPVLEDPPQATSTPDIIEEPLEEHASTTNQQLAEVKSDMDVNANSGSNNASSTDTTIIDTGNAYASANVINVINTTIFDSQGLFLMLTHFMEFLGNLDLRSLLAPVSQGDLASCNTEHCQSGALVSSSQASATVVNDVVVRSATGVNNASGTNAYIDTGQAYGAANVVNVVNTTIANSNYLILVFNNFGDLFGDIIFPGQSFFATPSSSPSQPASQPTPPAPLDNASSTQSLLNEQASSTQDVLTDNASSTSPIDSLHASGEADITNDIQTTTNTGDNTATSASSTPIIQTGSAQSANNVINQTNTNLFGGNAVVISLRIFGDWIGDIFSVPEGVGWKETSQGIQLISDGLGDSSSQPQGAVHASSSASITNKVKIFALTGENKIQADEAAAITTGNAYGAANVINIANTNVVGKNWIYAIINIFGNWKGSLSFGRPNLWIGQSVEVDTIPATPGSLASYTLTIANKGDADAHNVAVNSSSDPHQLSFLHASQGLATSTPSTLFWEIGTLKAGTTLTITYETTIDDEFPYGVSEVTTVAQVSAREPDQDTNDNTDTLSFAVMRHFPPGAVSHPSQPAPQANVFITDASGATLQPMLSISKTASASSTTLTTLQGIDYKITLINDSNGPLYQATMSDVMTDQEGRVVSEQEWNLDTVYPHEEITITYTMLFTATSTPGLYTNTATIKGLGGFSDSRGTPQEAQASFTMLLEEVNLQPPVQEITSTSTPVFFSDEVVVAPRRPRTQVFSYAALLPEEPVVYEDPLLLATSTPLQDHQPTASPYLALLLNDWFENPRLAFLTFLGGLLLALLLLARKKNEEQQMRFTTHHLYRK